MNKWIALALAFATTEISAHPGHGAPLGHLHAWDWAQAFMWAAFIAAGAWAAWKAK